VDEMGLWRFFVSSGILDEKSFGVVFSSIFRFIKE
jgi:hypothetical protein